MSGNAIAGQVGHRHVAWAGAGGQCELGGEGTVTVVHQDADRVRALVGSEDVELAVTGGVGHRHAPDTVADGVRQGGWNVPSPLERNTLTVSSIRLAVTTSWIPSPVKSP